MTLTKVEQHNIAIIRIAGRIDALTSTQFESQLFELLPPEASSIVLSFAECDFINSNGLRILLLLRKRMNTHGNVVVCALQRPIATVFDIAGFSGLFPLYADEQAAIDALNPSAAVIP